MSTATEADIGGQDITIATAALAVLIAAFVNSLVKATLSLGIGGTRLGTRVGIPTLLVVCAVLSHGG